MGLKIENSKCDLGTISLTFTTRRKMGILRRVVDQFHKAYDALSSIGLLYCTGKTLRRVVNLRCVVTSRKVTMGL